MKHALLLSIPHLLAWDRNSTGHETAWQSYNVAYEFIDLNGNLEEGWKICLSFMTSVSYQYPTAKNRKAGDLGRWEP